MIIDGTELAAAADIESDICIIGAGPAGITLALELEGDGRKIVLLEGGGLDYTDASQEIYTPASLPRDFPEARDTRLRYFGGSSNHWGGNCSPFSRADFERRDWIPHSGWPFSFDDLAPYYEQAHRYCELPFAPGDFATQAPNDPDLPWGRADRRLMVATGFSSPPTQFSEVYRDRLEQAEDLTVIVNGNVVGFTFDGVGERIASVQAKSFDRPAFDVKSKCFVLACGGLENARMLLQPSAVRPSGIGNEHDVVGRYFMEHPVIKAAMFQPSMPIDQLLQLAGPWQAFPEGSLFFQLSEDAQQEHGLANIRVPFSLVSRYFASAGVESMHTLTDALGDGEWPDEPFSHIGNIFYDLDMVAEGVARASFDVKLFDHAETIDQFFCDVMIEQTPDPDNRLTLAADKDALGLHKFDLSYRITDSDKDSLWRGMRLVAQALGEAGVGRVRLQENSGERLWEEGLINYGDHHMGTTRAAVSPRAGVVDGDLKVHGVNNLFVAGSSVFTTGAHVPPTLTIVALSARLAVHLKQREAS